MIAHQRVMPFAKCDFSIPVESKETMLLGLGVKFTVTGEVPNCLVDKDKWLAVVYIVMNLWVPLNSGKFYLYMGLTS